jgi:predicted dehydrogenase
MMKEISSRIINKIDKERRMEKLNIGVIGLGAIGQQHMQALKEVERANLLGVADINKEVAEKASEKFGAKSFTDYKEMLAMPGLDAVIVATPDEIHTEPCLDAAEAGKHILVEKPIATTIEDANAIIEATEKAKVKLMVGFSLRFNLHYMKVKKMVADGQFGDLISIFSRRLNLVTQADRINGRCGVLHFLGIHEFDVLRWIIGSEPVSIYTEESTSVPKKFPQDNESFSIIRFSNGVRACVHIGWNLPLQHLGGRDFKFDIMGTEGALYLDQMRQGIEVYSETLSKYPSVNSGLFIEDRAFVDCVLDDTPSPSTGADGLAALKMVMGAIESIETGLPVKIDI